MPVAGRKPKPDGQKRNRMKPTHDWVEVVDEPFAGGPSLPAKQPDGRAWPAWTKRWWKVVAALPHAVLWNEGDWQFALDTAVLVAAYHQGELRHAAEVRQREKVLGTTADARRDLRIRYVAESEPVEAQGVTSLDEYRESIS